MAVFHHKICGHIVTKESGGNAANPVMSGKHQSTKEQSWKKVVISVMEMPYVMTVLLPCFQRLPLHGTLKRTLT
jgi:hypothetical protein